jgi:VWFA-related protein
MKFQPIALLTLLFASLLWVMAQQPQPSPAQRTSPNQDEVVRVTTNLVQVDVVVTDKEGRQIGDLSAEDFEISEDKRKQSITNFSYISTSTETTGSAARRDATSSEAVRPAEVSVQPVRRVIAIVVDDLGLSGESISFVPAALKKFIAEDMQPKDLVAIIRTSAGAGSIQQFSSDKERLARAVDNIRFNPIGRGGLEPFAPIQSSQLSEEFKVSAQRMSQQDDQREGYFSVGALGTLQMTMRGLADVRGRKAIVFVSESFRLFNSEGRNQRLLDALHRLTDEANRSSVVIYTLDASGLQTLNLTAADKVNSQAYMFDKSILLPTPIPSPEALGARRVDAAADAERDSQSAFRNLRALEAVRNSQNVESQSVLSYLAQQTGGLYVHNRNDLGSGLESIVGDQKGYYLIGYKPEQPLIDPATGRRRFHNIDVKVKRSGLRVRARSGYYGITDEERKPAAKTADEQIAAALMSPFTASDIRVKLTSLFTEEPDRGPIVRSLLHIDAADIKLDELEGARRGELDIVVVLFGGEGRVLDQLAQRQTINIKGEAYTDLLRDGLNYVLDLPVKLSGATQIRVAVRDSLSEHVGSARQFIEVPDLSKNLLTLSGIVLRGTPATTSSNEASEGLASSAVRQLRQGMILNYAYTIYNAKVDSANQPKLKTQMRLFRDGQEVFQGKVSPYNVGQQTDLKRLSAGGRLVLGSNLIPGEYVLGVFVTDDLLKNNQNTASQWMNFEIVK